VLKLRDGRGLDSGEIRFARGNSQLPLHDDELRAKFVDCTSAVAYLDATSLFDQLMRLDGLRDVRELAQARGARRAA
jgi:aconitate decarboxylase